MKIHFILSKALAITFSLLFFFIVAENSGAYENIIKLSKNLFVFHGPINVGIIRHGEKALLIDCGDNVTTESLQEIGVKSVEMIIFTHHHRDQTCGVHAFAVKGAKIGVPAKERDCFINIEDYWNNPRNRWHIRNFHPYSLMLTEPIRFDYAYADGQSFNWGTARITTIATPGHTDGSVSYQVEVDDQLAIFSGDLIYDMGKVWDVHSLQKGFKRGEREISDSHGFLGAKYALINSLYRVKDAKPELLVPSHGRIITQPSEGIDLLVERLKECYDNYVSISALRHYFPELFAEYAGSLGHMKSQPVKKTPDCVRPIGTTWMLISKDKTAFIMDCGSVAVLAGIKELFVQESLYDVEGLWVTHYHDDHVDAVPEFQAIYDCICYADKSVAQVITKPLAWRLPFISPSIVSVDSITEDGQSWQWREFRMTAFHLPGQTLYHAALFVEKDDLKMLFVGDSFTPSGIDDYCALNRNWLGRGVGFDRCLELIEHLKPTHIFNCHVEAPFDFTPEQCRKMRLTLGNRKMLLEQLTPWDDANYGTDNSWVRVFPYEQKAVAGENINLEIIITNHSATTRKAACRVVPPRHWQSKSEPWHEKMIPPRDEGDVLISLKIPEQSKSGRYAIPVDVHYSDRLLPRFTETIVVVE